MKRSNIIAAIIALFAAVAMGWSTWSDRQGSEAVVATPAADSALEARAGEAARPTPHFPNPADEIDDASPAPEADQDLVREALIRSDPELLDRARQLELARAGEARWAEAVDGAEYSANDLDPSIREFFSDVDLEPRYVEGGLIEGLQIRALRDDHPLARAGFEVRDRLNRIQGVELNDPGEVPSLLARLGPNFSICSERNDGEHCAEIALD